jgi:hypothetical protein
MTQEDIRCAQLKFDKSQLPVKMFDCVRVRCPFNREGKFCINPQMWYLCRRQQEP